MRKVIGNGCKGCLEICERFDIFDLARRGIAECVVGQLSADSLAALAMELVHANAARALSWKGFLVGHNSEISSGKFVLAQSVSREPGAW